MKQINWVRLLTILAVVLAGYAILYVTGMVLLHFTQAILLFVLGGMLAYILTPLVRRLQAAFRLRWLAILLAYVFVAVGFVALGVLLFTPFIDQSQSLVENLHDPRVSSLGGIVHVERDAADVIRLLERQRGEIAAGLTLSPAQADDANLAISRLMKDAEGLRNGKVSGPSVGHHTTAPSRSSKLPAPPPQTSVPQSYVNTILAPIIRLSRQYAVSVSAGGDLTSLDHALHNARTARGRAATIYHTMATTPILLIHAQAWLDEHHLRINLPQEFGQAARQVSNQGTSILNNAITIVSATASIILNLFLVLVISVYLVSDGPRLVRGAVGLIPSGYREQGRFFMTSVDRVVGGYIRGQLLLSALAGVLGGGGAAVLGVPYPLLIGLMTFVLEAIPVIGPMVTAVPAVLISLFFAPPLATVALLVWFLVFQQVVTNVVGPRVLGTAVGIHPLEALLAVLVGYPLGGLMGAFLAVPIMGIVHLLIREAYNYFVLGHELPSASTTADVEEENLASERAVTAGFD